MGNPASLRSAVMKLHPIALAAAGFAAMAVAHALEFRGDMAPFADHGVSTERAIWHLSALIVLIAGLGCFIAGAVSLYRRFFRT